ncbi:Hypothetical protein Tpal_1075 [Trichococcus palustris]|uniref:Uncharacterized protein n=1 Tax=Trichococcus palustris TaxID=140314 RepID=A0A143YHE9_9LACT|nr:hypothetical protein [Trichococcus palustris]CZQ88975.1 Hypothetical protein Tpal_1075 [Trichococcus palustris]SFL00363.1 hypothetical protein SAMN04488076_11321 [Trichococcus palustris]
MIDGKKQEKTGYRKLSAIAYNSRGMNYNVLVNADSLMCATYFLYFVVYSGWAALEMRRCAYCKFQNNGEGLIKIQRIELKTVLMEIWVPK